jgi:4-hydroxybenzoate polyprenyltransferase
VSLKELRAIGVLAALIMLVTVFATGSVGLLVLLAILWSYFALMSAEFFASDWLTKRPTIYLGSHMVLLPILSWLVAGAQIEAAGDRALSLPLHAPFFLVAVLFLGVVLELGRKIRATADEERGVETYSALWGHERARAVWISSVALAALGALLAIIFVGGSLIVALVLIGTGLALLVIAHSRFTAEMAGSGKRIETASSLFVLSLLVALGAAPPLGASL